MSIKATQRSANANQSTVDYEVAQVFTYGNRYQTAVLNNNTGGLATFKDGFLVLRDLSTPGQVVPAIAGATLANVIGILKVESVDLASAGLAKANYALSGDIDASLLTLPAATTLDTIVGTTGKSLRDILTDLGFVLNNVTELTKFDN